MRGPKSDFSSNRKSFSWLTFNRVKSECILSLLQYQMNCKKYHKGNTRAGVVLAWSFGITLAGGIHISGTWHTLVITGAAHHVKDQPIKADLCSLNLLGAFSEKNTGGEGW